ncbi:hypothetical protein LJC34_03320 [Oscillospiraceae bacterium OttesenSCG-928-G22]|nr:hypothetical protein [Oscillospiraceae bacterium OttesenSCG-928-G22]
MKKHIACAVLVIAALTQVAFATSDATVDPVSVDRLKSDNGNGAMSVSVSFVDDSGAEHMLARQRSADDVTAITFDGYSIRQTNLDEAFGGAHVFMSIINPGYLINLPADRAREVLERILPVIAHEHDCILLHNGCYSK